MLLLLLRVADLRASLVLPPMGAWVCLACCSGCSSFVCDRRLGVDCLCLDEKRRWSGRTEMEREYALKATCNVHE